MALFAASAAGIFLLAFYVYAPDEKSVSNQPVVKLTVRRPTESGWLPVDSLLDLRYLTAADTTRLLDQVDEHWRDGYIPLLLEAAPVGSWQQTLVSSRLRERAGLPPGDSSAELWRWLWQEPVEPHPDYADFKARLYEPIDPRFAAYFDNDRATTIRLDEIRWGGVIRDGIPPLDKPKMLAAGSAKYLADTDVVFGIEVNGDARAYPKRILAWHEMFKDNVGGVSLCGVYCTLCGMVILYETQVDGVHHELGTSGFLYRSNKLMYDQATESLWSTTRGVPVVGPLVGKGIELKSQYVVTTTWGEWRRRHPETTVLSPDTGHSRDYGEGVAYRNYFATDRLMFPVPPLPPHPDEPSQLANKAEVLALRFGDAQPVAILADFLADQPVYRGEHAGQPYVVVTDTSGANRVYEAGDHQFEAATDDAETLVDASGARWQLSESQLTGPNGATLPRLPAHRAFWFGWRAAHPDTQLISE